MDINIISWNVNGLRAIAQKGLAAYVEAERPTIFCTQETKAHTEQLDTTLTEPSIGGVPYKAYYHSCAVRKGYSGVGVWTALEPKRIGTSIGVERFDQEGRVLELDFDEFVLFNVYFPNGENAEKGRLQYKLDFYDALFAHCATLQRAGRKIVVCGDYNTAHTADDLARPQENVNTSGFMPIEREKLDHLVRTGWRDSFREYTQGSGHYSWWSYRQGARARNIGWRIDYHFVTENLLPHLSHASIQHEIMGSDHCPVKLVLQI
jgi:exodeoxyribonuclease-3